MNYDYTWNTATNTAWVTGSIPAFGDFNRIENNELFLKERIDFLTNKSMWGGI